MTRPDGGSAGGLSSPEAEAAVLGGLLHGDESRAVGSLDVRVFTNPQHRKIFAAVQRLRAKDAPVDAVTVAAEVANNGSGQGTQWVAPLLADLMEAAVGQVSAAVPFHAATLADLARRRAAIEALQDLSQPPLEAVAGLREAEWGAGDGRDLPTPVRLLEAGEVEPPSFHVQDLLLHSDLNLFGSQGGDGKTGSAIHIGCAVINGSPCFDNPAFKVGLSGPVLYISEEDDLGVVRNRVEALAHGHRWDAEKTLGQFFVLARQGTSLDSEAWKAHLLDQILDLGIVLVIFDPYSELTTAEENSNTENKPVLRFLRRISNETGATVLLLHHVTKPSEGRKKIDRLRGFSGLRDAARLIMFLERTDLGTAFECVKMSRAALPPKFVVKRDVETDPENPASWTSARLTYLEETAADDMEAEKFVIDQLERHGVLNSSQIKELAKGTGLSAIDVSKAIRTLETVGRITFESGKQGAKNWSLQRLPGNSEQPRQPTLPACSKVAEQGSEAALEGCPALYRAGNQAALDLATEQPGKVTEKRTEKEGEQWL